jgi:PAS domain-containing protein
VGLKVAPGLNRIGAALASATYTEANKVSEIREAVTRASSGRSALVESMATRMLVRNPITHSPKAVTGRETRRVTQSEDSFVLLRLVAESLPNGVLVVDHKRGIVLANQQIERQFDYSRNDLLGQSIDLLLPEGRPHRIQSDDWTRTQALGPSSRRARVPDCSHTQPTEGGAVPLHARVYR